MDYEKKTRTYLVILLVFYNFKVIVHLLILLENSTLSICCSNLQNYHYT